MEITYLVYEIGALATELKLIGEETRIEDCNVYLLSENIRVVKSWRKIQ